MVSFYPSEKETRFVPFTLEQFYVTLEKHVKPLKEEIPDSVSKRFLFSGSWNNDTFLISLNQRVTNSFTPNIKGDFIPSEGGTHIRLTYELFPAKKRSVLIWTVLTLLMTIFFIGLYQAWWYGASSFAACLVNYILTRENFKIQAMKSKRMMGKMFL